jgi:hypothetical protein
MTTKNDILLAVKNNTLSTNDKVSILELLAHEVGIMTISEMARHEGKSPNGIKTSKKYGKVKIGGQLMAIKGYSNNLPF